MIRRLGKADLSAAAELWLDTNIKAHHFIPEQYWTDRYEAVKGMLAQAELYGCEEEGGVQGFVGLDGDYIAGIFVRGEAQSRGIGRQLLNHIKSGKRQLSLRVYEKNVRAIQFYQREGFVLEDRGTDEDTGEAEFRMVWKR